MTPPSAPRIAITTVGCDMRIDWAEATSSSSPVSSYLLEISGQNGRWNSVPQCTMNSRGLQSGGIYAFSCVLRKSQIAAAPFYLQSNVAVRARVTALNGAGQGGWGQSVQPATVPSGPTGIVGLVAQLTGNSVRLNWSPSNAQGVTYTVRVDYGSGPQNAVDNYRQTSYTAQI